MPHLTVKIENERGVGLNGVLLESGRYDTTPCSWEQQLAGCTSGAGNAIQGTTDSNGECSWSIPYTCAGEWSGTWKTDGFVDLPWDQKTGSVTGDIGGSAWTYQMVQTQAAAIAEQKAAAAVAINAAIAKGESQSQAQADAAVAVAAVTQNSGPNWLAGDIADQVAAAYTSGSASAGKTSSDFFGAIKDYWWLILLFVVVGAVALFIVLRGKEGGGTRIGPKIKANLTLNKPTAVIA